MRHGRTVTLTPNPALDLWTGTQSVKAGPKLRCSAPRVDPGGGGINVSRVIRILGGETTAIYLKGGLTGEALALALAAAGIEGSAVETAAATRQSFSVQEETTGAVYRFVLPGEPAGEADAAAMLERVSQLAPTAAVVVGSGSLPPGMDKDFWAHAARRAKAAGAAFLLDSGDGVPPALAEGVDIYRENTSAIARFENQAISWPHEAAEWAEARISQGAAQTIIITEGDRGALMVTAQGRVVMQPPKVPVASAIGAGDSFVGALCFALSHDRSPEEALRLAVATAAATLLTPATELCRLADIERLLLQVTRVDA